MKKEKLVQLIQISIFAAISSVIAFIEIPVFFAPGFYKLDLSDAIILISGFSLGPAAGILSQAVKTLLILILKGSTSFGIGEMANFIIGVSLVLPSAVIYKKYRTFKGACISMLIGIFSLVIVACAINYLILLPVYEALFSINESTIISLGHAINPMITDKFTFILFAVCPFNLLKGILVCILSLLLYKKLSAVINKVSIIRKR